MAGLKKYQEKLVFGLDIGTRSIVGTVGYKEGDHFVVAAQRSKEHETRAMLDGQIHDIGKVGDTIADIKRQLEEVIQEPLTDVCIAAAGRVLRTVTTKVEQDFSSEREVTEEDVYALSALGVENAYEEFLKANDMDMKFYCVGYSVIRYYMNHYPMGNLIGHKARTVGGDFIVTFLPEDVVDGLYKAVELAGLHVAHLTLEPIAAIQVAIPEMYRMLNIALVDVGAGTSDISITKDGAIVAYGMIPMAGDSLTEILAQHCLVDFVTAEQVKRQIGVSDVIEYKDIMGLPQTISSEEAMEILRPTIENMTRPVAECIRELNGDKSVSAVFVVGGGGKIPGYTETLAEELGILKERVAVRGEEVMGKIDFLEEDVQKDSLLVTPIGICMSFYEQSNNFIFVTFNNQRIKIYDNGSLAVVDAAMQAEFPNDGLFPKRGRELEFFVNGKSRIQRGLLGEAAVILVNGQSADIHTPVHSNDVITVRRSTAGEAAQVMLSQLPEFQENISVIVNDQKILLPKFAMVNGELKSGYYEIQSGDDVRMLDFYTVQQIVEFMDVQLSPGFYIYVNNFRAMSDTPVYENFTVIWTLEELHFEAEENREKQEEWEDLTEETFLTGQKDRTGETDENRQADWNGNKNRTGQENDYGWEEDTGKDNRYAGEQRKTEPAQEEAAGKDSDSGGNSSSGKDISSGETASADNTVIVTVNQVPVSLRGKSAYIFVDVFDYIDFDLSKPQGLGIVTNLNGQPAEYMKELKNGDVIDIYWKN